MTSGTRDYSKYRICVFITQLHYELGVLGSDVKGLYENLGGILLLGGVPCGITPTTDHDAAQRRDHLLKMCHTPK
jgi:hypothetical protein